MKKLIAIVGNCGSGKTSLAKSLAKRGYKHIELDKFYALAKRRTKGEWYLDIKYQKEAYDLFEKEIKRALKKRKVVVDSSGGHIYFKAIKKRLPMIIVKIKLSIGECWKRTKKRREKVKHPARLSDIKYISTQINQNGIKPDLVIDGRKPIRTNVKRIIDYIKTR